MGRQSLGLIGGGEEVAGDKMDWLLLGERVTDERMEEE